MYFYMYIKSQIRAFLIINRQEKKVEGNMVGNIRLFTFFFFNEKN